MKINVKTNKRGFTLIELLIASTIFTFIILIATSGIIRIGQLYYKGITQAQTQETARNISDEFSRSVQFANGVKYVTLPAPGDPDDAFAVQQFCLGDTRYTVYPDQKYTLETPQAGIVAETLDPAGSNCECDTCVSDTKQLLSNNMRVLKLDISRNTAGDDKAWKVNLRLAYGDNDLLTHYDENGNLDVSADPDERRTSLEQASCKNGIPGTSFCAIAQLDTVAKKRLN